MSETTPDAAARLAEIAELRRLRQRWIDSLDGNMPDRQSRQDYATALVAAAPWLLAAAERGLMAEREEKHADRD